VNEEFRRRVKTQGSFPTEGAALVLLFGLIASAPAATSKSPTCGRVKVLHLRDGTEAC
jgi:transposase-like protein